MRITQDGESATAGLCLPNRRSSLRLALCALLACFISTFQLFAISAFLPAPFRRRERVRASMQPLAVSFSICTQRGVHAFKMRKIRIMEHVSLDGVISPPGDSDFAQGGWGLLNRDDMASRPD